MKYLSGGFCQGSAHHVLLSGDRQFQFISFQTCFHSAMEWKAHLMRGFAESNFAKFLTCRIKKSPDFGLEHWRLSHPWETKSLGPLLHTFLQMGTPSAKHFWENEKAHWMKIQIRSIQLLMLFTLNLQTPALHNAWPSKCVCHTMCFSASFSALHHKPPVKQAIAEGMEVSYVFERLDKTCKTAPTTPTQQKVWCGTHRCSGSVTTSLQWP